jgi:hypothetical protein
VSCIAGQTGCHVYPVHDHATWDMNHGRSAMLPPGGTFTGFISCQNCHGTDFKGTVISKQSGCFSANSCHFHPEGMPHDPWNGSSPDFFQHTHVDTAEGNAPVCYQCHNRVTHHRYYYFTGSIYTPVYTSYTSFNNLLSTRQGAPAGTPPGCYNSTMCHTDLRQTATPPAPTYIWPPPTSPDLVPPIWPAANAPNQ